VTIGLQDARSCADRAIAVAQRAGARIGICVVDAVGTVVHLDRMDGAALATTDLAEAKALSALNFQLPTSRIAETIGEHELTSVREALRFPLLTQPGGVPIVRGVTTIGSLGVAGGTAEQDELIALAALGVDG
jgi:uncharacterized protein GlcG (DUF336 family)